MDSFANNLHTTGIIIAGAGLLLIMLAIVLAVLKKWRFRGTALSIVLGLLLLAPGSGLVLLSSYLRSYTAYNREQPLGWVYTHQYDRRIDIDFYDETTQRHHTLGIDGDQWMIEGRILRWHRALRWLGAGSYYKLDRFTGRWENPPPGAAFSFYQINPPDRLWQWLLKNQKYLPLVDAAYGIGAFQYPLPDTVDVSIDDTGFILRTR